MSLFNSDEDFDYGYGNGSQNFGNNNYDGGTGLGSDSGFVNGLGSTRLGSGLGQGFGTGNPDNGGSLDFGSGPAWTGQGGGYGTQPSGLGFNSGGYGFGANTGFGNASGFGSGGFANASGTGSLDFGLKTYGQADDARTDPVWSDPYNRPQTKGPFAGWSTNAMDKFKESVSPRDYGYFLQDRIGTYVANRINMDRPPLTPATSYHPVDYGQADGLYEQAIGTRGIGRTDEDLGITPGTQAATNTMEMPAPVATGSAGSRADLIADYMRRTDPSRLLEPDHPFAKALAEMTPSIKANYALALFHNSVGIGGVPRDENPWADAYFTERYRPLVTGGNTSDGDYLVSGDNGRNPEQGVGFKLLCSELCRGLTGSTQNKYVQADSSRQAGDESNSMNFGNKTPNTTGIRGLLNDGLQYGRDFVGGAEDLYRNYQDMRTANTIGADKYFHCMGHCQASRRGPGGRGASEVIGEGRELFDEYAKGDSRAECDADRAANATGRDGNPSEPCGQVCQPLRPRGLDPKY